MSGLQKRFPIYSALLDLYPAQYRKDFGEQILQATADMLDGTTSKSERMRIWFAISLNIPGDAMRQQIISTGEHMNANRRIIVSVLWVTVCVAAVWLFPELRRIGIAWTDTAGFLRVVYLSLFILVFIVATPIMAVLSWFDRPKSLYVRLAKV